MITPNRAIALYHLRMNPLRRKKITGSLRDECDGRCALGLIAEAFGIEIPVNPDDQNDIYSDMKARLSLLYPGEVYGINDGDACRYDSDYDRVADKLEQMWVKDGVTKDYQYDNET